MQPCGRPSEVQFFGNDDEAAKVAKLHGYYLPTGYLRLLGTSCGKPGRLAAQV
jgi:hypothetical protein